MRVIDDFHDCDRDGVRGQREPEDDPGGKTRCQQWPRGQRIAEEKGEHHRQRDSGGVAPIQCGPDHHPQYLTNRTPGQAVYRCAERQPIQGRAG